MGRIALALGGTVLLVGLLVMLPFTMLGSAQALGGYGSGLRTGSVPAAYTDLVLAAGRTCPAAPPSVLAAQLEAESGWNPRAVSPAGAQGIAQFMPGTWSTWGVDGNGDGRRDVWNPADAIPSQARYDCALAEQLAKALKDGRVTGSLTALMLAAYNAGPGAVLAAGGIPSISETQNYVAKITSRAAAFSDSTGTDLPTGGFASRFIAAARGQLGVPYSWAGGNFAGPTEGTAQGRGTIGFDCSGLVLFAAYQASDGAIRLPHLADLQTRTGTPVPLDQLRPGDVISFTYPGVQEAHHIGIYLGDGKMINAPSTGSVVRIDNLNTAYWKNQGWRAARYSG